jgi:hypothetical protein
MITTWYLHSHLTWDRHCQSCIGSSFLPHGAFLEGGAYAISRRVHHVPLEALQVARPEAVGLARTKLIPNTSEAYEAYWCQSQCHGVASKWMKMMLGRRTLESALAPG